MIKHLKKFIVLIIFSMVFFACQENAIDSMSDQESSVSNLSKIEFTRIDIDKNTLSKRNSTNFLIGFLFAETYLCRL